MLREGLDATLDARAWCQELRTGQRGGKQRSSQTFLYIIIIIIITRCEAPFQALFSGLITSITKLEFCSYWSILLSFEGTAKLCVFLARRQVQVLINLG